jgi:hypothetical protein
MEQVRKNCKNELTKTSLIEHETNQNLDLLEEKFLDFSRNFKAIKDYDSILSSMKFSEYQDTHHDM